MLGLATCKQIIIVDSGLYICTARLAAPVMNLTRSERLRRAEFGEIFIPKAATPHRARRIPKHTADAKALLTT